VATIGGRLEGLDEVVMGRGGLWYREKEWGGGGKGGKEGTEYAEYGRIGEARRDVRVNTNRVKRVS